MAKLKSGNAVVRLLLAHGEKLGILIFLGCAGMLFWSALGIDHLDKEPSDLESVTRNAQNRIREATWDSVDPNNKVVCLTSAGAGVMTKIPAEHFPPLEYPLNPPVLKAIQLRLDPQILPVEDLEVYGDSGLWANADEAVIRANKLAALQKAQQEQLESQAEQDRLNREEGEGGRESALYGGRRPNRGPEGTRDETNKRARRDGPVIVGSSSRASLQGFEEIRSESWVTVVGKIPIEQQTKIYDSALENASGYDPGRDLPEYKGYEVQRAELTTEGLSDWKTLEIVSSKVLDKKIQTYPFDSPDLISERFIHPLMTHPLPPMVLREWDRRVTHSDIPLIEEEQPEEMFDAMPAESETDSAEDEDVFASRDDQFGGGRLGFGGEEDGPMRRRPGGRTGRTARRGGPAGYPGMMRGGGEFGGEGAMGMRGGLGGRRGGSGAMFAWDGQTSHILFRYFDNTVTAGSRYRYRIRLVMADVNNDVGEQYLDKSVLDRRSQLKGNKKRYRFTDWSPQSPIASVPLPARVYVAGAEPAKKSGGEPEVEMVVKAFDSTVPAEFAKVEQFLRGTVLNPLEKADVVWVQSSNLEVEVEEKLKEEFQFRTGVTVVDIRGGKKLSTRNKDLVRPARVLLMDPAGRLYIQGELEDRESVKDFEYAQEGGGTNNLRGFGGGPPRGRGGPEGEFSPEGF